MGFGFNLVEVLWVGSRLVCVAGAEGGVGGVACGDLLLGLGCCVGCWWGARATRFGGGLRNAGVDNAEWDGVCVGWDGAGFGSGKVKR